jgi:hypothetical protein
MKILNEHIKNIRDIAKSNQILLMDAINHYMERNELDPYFIADIIQSDKIFFTEIKEEAKKLKLVK